LIKRQILFSAIEKSISNVESVNFKSYLASHSKVIGKYLRTSVNI
jgi:hypothetical protein